MKKENVEELFRQARNEDLMSSHSVEKFAFQSLLTGMIAKLILKKGEQVEEQLATLQRMDRFLERLTFFNVLFVFQAKVIIEQDRQIAILEQEKMDLIKENTNLRKNI